MITPRIDDNLAGFPLCGIMALTGFDIHREVRRSATFRGLSEAKASAKFKKRKKFRVVPQSSAQNINAKGINEKSSVH